MNPYFICRYEPLPLSFASSLCTQHYQDSVIFLKIHIPQLFWWNHQFGKCYLNMIQSQQMILFQIYLNLHESKVRLYHSDQESSGTHLETDRHLALDLGNSNKVHKYHMSLLSTLLHKCMNYLGSCLSLSRYHVNKEIWKYKYKIHSSKANIFRSSLITGITPFENAKRWLGKIHSQFCF